MILTGTHPRTIDDKKRLALPKRLREQMGGPAQLFVTPGPGRSLWLFTQDCLERQAERFEQGTADGPEARVFRRLYFAQTEAVDVDSSGRILLPERLAVPAGFGHEVVLLGVRDHLELWDARRWGEYLEQHAAGMEELGML